MLYYVIYYYLFISMFETTLLVYLLNYKIKLVYLFYLF